MEKREILFAIFGSVICILAGIGTYFLGRSNKRFMKDLERKKFNEKAAH